MQITHQCDKNHKSSDRSKVALDVSADKDFSCVLGSGCRSDKFATAMPVRDRVAKTGLCLRG